MNPPTEISPSIRFLLDEIHRRFDESDARFDRLFARLQQPARGRAPSSCNDDSGSVPVDAFVTSTEPDAPLSTDQKLVRYGPVNTPASESLRPASEKGFSIALDDAPPMREPRDAVEELRIGALKLSDVLEERVCELASSDTTAPPPPTAQNSVPAPPSDLLDGVDVGASACTIPDAASVADISLELASDAEVVPDNWGGLFEQPAHDPEERDLDLSAIDVFGSAQIRNEHGLTSTVPVALLDIVHEPAPMLDAAESPHRLAAALDDIVDLDRLSLLPDVLLRDIVSRLPIKDAARTAVLSRRWRPLCASPSVSLVQMEAQPFFLVACTKQERRPIIRAEGMGASGRVFVGVNIQRLHDDPGLLHCVCLGPVMCVLRATPLGGYYGSLDDDPESGVTHFDAPLDRAVGRDGQAPPAAATLRPDAVGAGGGGLLAWVMAARSAQATCSTICSAVDSSFADVPIGALWEEEMLRWSTTGGLGDVLGGLPPAMAAKGSHGMTWSTHVAEATPTSSTTSTLPGASTPSPAMLSSISLEHASSGARQVFEEWSLHADIFCNICIGFELPSRMSLGVNQHQPCPPTHVQVEFGCGSADVRPLPWPSFTLGNCCSVSQAVCWKPPWPLPSLQGVRIGIGAMLCLFPVVAWLPHWLCFHFLWKPPWQLPALVIPTYSVQLKRGGLTQFDSHSLFHVFGISCWGLLAEMRPISSMVLLLSIFGHSANMLVLDGPVTLVGILGWCRFPRCFLLLSSIWPVKKERQLLGSGLVLNLVGYSNMHMLTFELRSIPMQLIKYASVHFLPSAPNSILVSLKCGNHLKLEVSVPVYKFNSNIMLLHQFTTTVQAPPIGAMWLLLAINSLAHEEFQFGFEIEKMMRTTVMVLLHIFTMEASGNHLISFPEILNWAWERWISIFLAQVDLFRLVPWDPGGLQLLLSVSMAGCALIQQRVQRKCGGNCRCFLLEVTGQNFPVATPCIKCKVFCREFILLDMGFLTTNKEVQCNVDCFSSTYSEEEFLQFPWDLGGSELLHRLGGKPNFKKGGMSGICVGWTAMWGRTVRQKQRQGQASTKGQDGKRKGIEELFRRLPSPSTFYCSSSFHSPSLLYLDFLLPVPSRIFLLASIPLLATFSQILSHIVWDHSMRAYCDCVGAICVLSSRVCAANNWYQRQSILGLAP